VKQRIKNKTQYIGIGINKSRRNYILAKNNIDRLLMTSGAAHSCLVDVFYHYLFIYLLNS